MRGSSFKSPNITSTPIMSVGLTQILEERLVVLQALSNRVGWQSEDREERLASRLDAKCAVRGLDSRDVQQARKTPMATE